MADVGQSLIRIDLEDGYRFTVSFDQEDMPPLQADEPPPLGGGQGPNPGRLLAAAIATCLGASALFCLRKARIDVHGLQADATSSVVRNERGRLRVEEIRVRLRPRVADADLPRVGRCLELFEDYCVVTQSIRDGIAIDVDVEAVASGQPA